jgi:hypothetical protein
MPLDFTSPPTLGDIYTSGGRAWRFDGLGWRAHSTGSGAGAGSAAAIARWVTTPEVVSGSNTLTSSTQLSVTLAAGTYFIDCSLTVRPSDTSRGTRARFHFAGVGTAHLTQHMAAPQSGFSGTELDNAQFAYRPAGYVFGAEWVEDSIQYQADKLVLVVTTPGVFSAQFAQKFTDPEHSATLIRGHLYITPVP